ncbi:MAG: NAD(P) transhydrogenase subunit alpha [Oscillospiraceae bacterium]|nr:NAD(P) transhydrogenase subunit alpha [Oscillospiraceae bacterium]
MNPVLLVVLFVVSAVLGYLIIRNVPALLHTPLMSGMNALSGITVLGAIIAAFQSRGILALVLALGAAVLAMINVAGGFALTHKMLSSFVKKGAKKEDA